MRAPVLIFLAAAVGAGASACREPTQITLQVDTDVDCDKLVGHGGTAIIGGAPTDDPVTITRDCSGAGPLRTIGSLVIAPSGKRDDVVSISVVAGATSPLNACAAADFAGCIVARRRLRFVPHEPLELRVRLSSACIGIKCAEDRTCVDGRCVTADVDDPAFCSTTQECDARLLTGVDAGAEASADAAPDRTSVPPPPRYALPQHLVTTPSPAFGVAADGDGLYWTTDQGAFGESWSALASAGPASSFQRRVPSDTFRGIAVFGAETFVADVQNGPTCVTVYSPTWASLRTRGCASGGAFSVDVADSSGGVPLLVGIAANAFVANPLDNGLNVPVSASPSPFPTPNANSYLESNHSGVAYFSEGATVHKVTFAATLSVSAVPLYNIPPGTPLVGIALGATHHYVTNIEGDVFEVIPSTGVATKLANLPGAQDLVVARRTPTSAADLFIAAGNGKGNNGIWVIAGVEP